MFGKTQKRVLFVDHEAQIQTVVKSVLEGANFKVVTTSSREEAIRELSKKEFDLIISELELPPVRNGIQLYKHIKNEVKTKNIPFLFATPSDPKNLQNLLQNGDEVIAKPFQPKTLVKAVEEFLEHRNKKTVAPNKNTQKNPEKPKPKTQPSSKAPKMTKENENQPEKNKDGAQRLSVVFVPRKKKKKKKSRFRMAPLPPGKSTQFFSQEPSCPFDVKDMKTYFSQRLRNLKADSHQQGEYIFNEVADDFQKFSRRVLSQMITDQEYASSLSETPFCEENMEDWDKPDGGKISQTELDEVKNAFLQYVTINFPEVQLENFQELAILDYDEGWIYSDIENLRQENITAWKDFLGSIKNLFMKLGRTSCNYALLELNDCYNLVVNLPEASSFGILFSNEKLPLHDIFKEEALATATDTEEVSQESQPLSKLPQDDSLAVILNKMPEVVEEQQATCVIQSSESGVIISSHKPEVTPEEFHEIMHNMISMAGLCQQISNKDFEVDYVVLTTDDGEVAMVNDQGNELFMLGEFSKIKWK